MPDFYVFLHVPIDVPPQWQYLGKVTATGANQAAQVKAAVEQAADAAGLPDDGRCFVAETSAVKFLDVDAGQVRQWTRRASLSESQEP